MGYVKLVLAVLFTALFLIIGVPIWCIVWIIGKFDPKAKDQASFKYVAFGMRTVWKIAGVKLTTIGLENVPRDRNVLYVSNHRSFFDAIITDSQVPRITGYIAKKELAKVPLLGMWMKNIYCLFLDREDIKQGLQVILTAIEGAKNGISYFICPEGTRNKGGDELLPFHAASFKIATRAGIPVVPVTCVNTNAVLEDHFPKIAGVHVIIEYGTPIETKGMSRDEIKELPDRVRDIIQETYLKNKKEI